MTQGIEVSGRTVEEAVREALAHLELPRERVQVDVLEEPTRGVLGLIGQRPARVRVTPRPDPAEKAREFLEGLLHLMGYPHASVKAESGEGMLRLDIEGRDLGGVIGRRGATLDSLQYLVGLVASRYARGAGERGEHGDDEGGRLRILVDVEGYRRKREEALKRLARGIAERVRREGKRVALEPMNPMERRIVHLVVQECPGVVSFSEGEEPYRYVVISPASEQGQGGQAE